MNIIDKDMIAPCGMNCFICLAHLRTKNYCSGCMSTDSNKVDHCMVCRIRNCDKLLTAYCFNCDDYPCDKIRHLDKRYRGKYHMSMIDNLNYIKVNSLDKFLLMEANKWTCKSCGAILTCHRDNCLKCGAKY